MNTRKETIKLFCTTSILTVIGMLSVVLCLINPFFGGEIASLAAIIMFVVVLSIAFSAAATFVKKGIISFGVIIILWGLFFLINREDIIGGLANLVDTVIYGLVHFFGKTLYIIDIQGDCLEAANEKMALFYVLFLLVLVYAYTIARNIMIWVPLCLTLFLCAVPAIIGVAPYFALLIAIVFCVQVIIVGMSYRRKDTDALQRVSLAIGTLLVLICSIIMLIFPENKYKRPDFYRSTIDRIVKFFSDSNDDEDENGQNITFSYGHVGDRDSIKQTGTIIGTISCAKEMTRLNCPIYINSYAARNFVNNQWTDEETISMTDLATGVFLSGFAENMELDYCESDYVMAVVEGLEEYNFYPSYSRSLTSFINIAESEQEKLGGWQAEINTFYFEKRKYLSIGTTPKMEKMFREMFSGYDVHTQEGRYQVACEVKKYLADNCTYTLSPGKVPDGEDVVEYFLTKSKKGYCTYFATAAVMMMRCAGIPTRYVEGFSVDMESSEDCTDTGKMEIYQGGDKYTDKSHSFATKQITDKDAHAWIQYFCDGVGWLNFEVTPGSPHSEIPPEETTPQETTSAPEQTTSSQSETTTTHTQASETQDSTTIPEDTKSKTHSFKLSKKAIRIIIIVFVCVLLLGLGYVVIIIRHNIAKQQIDDAVDNESQLSVDDRAILIYNRYIKILKYMGIIRTHNMTEDEFAKVVGECSYLDVEAANTMAKLFKKATFSRLAVDESEIKQMADIYRRLIENIYAEVNFIKKIYYRFVLNF